MDLYLIKDGNNKVIEINEDINNNYCSLIDKYVNKDNYSLVIYDNQNNNLITGINKNIIKEDYDNILNTTRNIYDNNKIFKYCCYNYLDGDYEVVNESDKYKINNSITLFCEEKLGNESYYVKNILNNFRTLNLRNCLLDNYKEEYPNNRNNGVILIGEDIRKDISLTKNTHAELIDEYSKNNNWDLKDKNTIVVIVSRRSLFIEVPDNINDFQRSELINIDKEISYVKDMHMPIYVDVVKNGILYNDISEVLDVKVKEKDNSNR